MREETGSKGENSLKKGFYPWHSPIYLINFAELYDFEVHEEKVCGGYCIDAKADVNDGVKNFTVFASHKKSLKVDFFLWNKKNIPYHPDFETVKNNFFE